MKQHSLYVLGLGVAGLILVLGFSFHHLPLETSSEVNVEKSSNCSGEHKRSSTSLSTF